MKLQVVKTDKGYVAVKEFTKNYPWYLNYTDGICPNKDFGQGWMVGLRDIVATDITFKLEGISQFKLEKDELEKELRSIIAEDWCKHKDDEPYIEQTADACYKAVQSKGYFSEKDIVKIIGTVAATVRRYGYGYHSVAMAYAKQWVQDNQSFLQSLKQPKKLVAIEVETQKVPVISDKEYEELEKGTREYTDTKPFDIELVVPQNKSEQYPDGLLTIKQYFYE